MSDEKKRMVAFSIYVGPEVREAMKQAGMVNWSQLLRRTVVAKLLELGCPEEKLEPKAKAPNFS